MKKLKNKSRNSKRQIAIGDDFTSSINNSVTFSGQPIKSEEFFHQIVEALDIIIDRRPKRRAHKMEN